MDWIGLDWIGLDRVGLNWGGKGEREREREKGREKGRGRGKRHNILTRHSLPLGDMSSTVPAEEWWVDWGGGTMDSGLHTALPSHVSWRLIL